MDILGKLFVFFKVGKLFVFVFVECEIDVVMIVVMKGIFLVYVVVSYLNVFVVIVCKDNKVIEGFIVSINYVLGFLNCI